MGLVVAMLAVCGFAALVRLFLRPMGAMWTRPCGVSCQLGIDLLCGLYGLWSSG